MKIEKNLIKKYIDKSKPNEIFALIFNAYDRDSIKTTQLNVGNFMNIDNTYLIVVVKK